MICRDLIEFLVDYLEGTLPTEQRNEFESHLKDCPPCVAYLETYRQTIALGKVCLDDKVQPAAPKMPEDLVKAILAAKAAKGPPPQ